MGLLMWDASGLDLTVMQGFANEQGFALRDNWWLTEVLHTGGRQLAGVEFLALMTMIGWPVGWFRALTRWQRIEIVLGIALSLLAISTLKHFSLTSCPWDLQAFGGKASYVSHWTWGTRDGGAGHCFPAGHASSALAFIALALPWLFSGNARLHRRGQWLLLLVLFSGLVLGLAQTLRGAHYPSHSLWTAWICWIVALVNHLVFNWLGKH
jgi:membrane-associated PAP2 superfamily phosphatase